MNTFQPYATAMRERGHGIRVGIASVADYRGLPGAAACSASKAAAIRYLESLRVELRGDLGCRAQFAVRCSCSKTFPCTSNCR